MSTNLTPHFDDVQSHYDLSDDSRPAAIGCSR